MKCSFGHETDPLLLPGCSRCGRFWWGADCAAPFCDFWELTDNELDVINGRNNPDTDYDEVNAMIGLEDAMAHIDNDCDGVVQVDGSQEVATLVGELLDLATEQRPLQQRALLLALYGLTVAESARSRGVSVGVERGHRSGAIYGLTRAVGLRMAFIPHWSPHRQPNIHRYRWERLPPHYKWSGE